MRTNLLRFLTVLSLALVVALAAAGPVRAGAVFDGMYTIPGTGETGSTTITIDPTGPTMTISCVAPDFILCEACPFTITLTGTSVPGGTEYSGPLPPPAGTGTITVTIENDGDVTMSATDIPGYMPPSAFFAGTGTIDDPTLTAVTNDISVDFVADAGQPAFIAGQMGSLTASVTTPLPAPALPWPMMVMLAALLVTLGVWWSRLRLVRGA